MVRFSYRWVVFCFAFLLAGLMALNSPDAVAASSNGRDLSGYQDASNASDAGDRNFISVPGVFTLWLGSSSSVQDGSLILEGTRVELPVINATATIDGLTLGIGGGSYGWDAITVSQVEPSGGDAVTISNTQATVQGQAANFSTEVSTRIDVHPDEKTQAGATVTVSYDGLTGQAGFAVADGRAQMAVGPATVAVEGLNAGGGTFAIDTAQVVFPEAGTGVRLDGYRLEEGNATWDALAWYGREFQLGELATLSDNLVVIPGPGSTGMTEIGATTRFGIRAGEQSGANGQLVFTYDRTTGEPSLALRNGNAALGVPGWNVTVNGINTGQGGATVDSVQLAADPLNVRAQATGLVLDDSSGLSFDQARLRYQPDQAAEGQAIAGFDLVLDSTEAGYVVTTTTLLPTARAN